ncbi:MAG TPA: hypothetical protein VD978_22870 [Azospirillum sp.]|nr:hypothetical protein [Azospirillum sp.]
MPRMLMVGMSVFALVAVSGCAQDTSGRAATNAGTSGSTLSGTGDDSTVGVQPPSRPGSANPQGAGAPMQLGNRRPSETPGTLSGDAGKRTTGELGGN